MLGLVIGGVGGAAASADGTSFYGYVRSEQVHQLYGSDVQITANLLRGSVTIDRPGGVDIATFAGIGKMYRETWGAQVLVAVGRVVYSVSAANEATARTIAAGLRVLPRS